MVERLSLEIARLRRGMTQQELADAAGVHVVSISNIERGKRRPRPRTRKRIAEALGVAIDQIWELANGDAEDDRDREAPGTAPSRD